MRSVVLLGVLALAASACDGAAPLRAAHVDEGLRARVRAYLGTIDDPVEPERWRDLGPAAVPLLEAALAEEPLPSRRARAIAGLAAIGGERARAVVLSSARDEALPASVRAAAIRAAPGVGAEGELSALLRPILRETRSPRLRAVAAEVLARHGGDQGCAAVREADAAGGARSRLPVAIAECERKARSP